MAIELATKFMPYVDEQFTTESKRALITNQDFEWYPRANMIKIYKISAAAMHDYGRTGPETGNWSRYGAMQGAGRDHASMVVTKDRSFTFAIDKLGRGRDRAAA